MAERYFTEEITAIPFRTLRDFMSTVAPGPLAFGLAALFRLRGLVGWPLKPSYAVGELGSETVVERNGLPPRALARWAPLTEQLADLGFRPLRYSIADMIGAKEHVAAVFLDGVGSTLATLEWVRMRGADGIEEKTPLEFNSYGDKDPEIMTGYVNDEDAALAGMLQLDFVDTLVLSNRLSLQEAHKQHQARIPVHSVYQMTPEAALKENDKRRERRFAWVLETGLLRPLRSSEVARVRELRLE